MAEIIPITRLIGEVNLIWIMPAKGTMRYESPLFSSAIQPEFVTRVKPGDCVALLTRDSVGRILVVQENEANEEHGRTAGTWSIPTETCEMNDRTFLDTSYALLVEEISGNLFSFHFFSNSYRYDNKPYVSKPEFRYGLHSAVLVCHAPDLIFSFKSLFKDEIINYAWVSLEELQKMNGLPFESEALQLIKYYKREGFLEPTDIQYA